MKKVILTVLVVFGLFPLKASAPKGELTNYNKYYSYQEQLEKSFATKLVINEIEINRMNSLQKLFDATSILGNTENKKAIKELSNKLKFNESWLPLIIYKENRGCTKTLNSSTGAVGIIQWLPSTAKALGTSVEELSKMTFTEQLQYVEKYLVYNKVIGKINSYEDLYLSIFFPKALGKEDSFIMGIKAPKSTPTDSMTFSQKVYAFNKPLDVDKNGFITVEDFKKFANTFN